MRALLVVLFLVFGAQAQAGDVAKDEVTGSFKAATAACSAVGVFPTIAAVVECVAAAYPNVHSCNIAGLPPGPTVPYKPALPFPVWAPGGPASGKFSIWADCSGVMEPYNGAAPHTIIRDWTRSTVPACPEGTTDSGDGTATPCVCPGAGVWNAGMSQCVADCAGSQGQPISSGYYQLGENAWTPPVLLACTDGCEAIFDGVSPAGSTIVGGTKYWYAQGKYIGTGNACSPGSPEHPPAGDAYDAPPDAECGPGEVGGEINGRRVCVDQGTGEVSEPSKDRSTEESTTEVEEQPDGGIKETTITTKCDASGNCSKTTTTKTTRADGSSTTKTETTPLSGDGNPSDGREKEEEEDVGKCEDGDDRLQCLRLGDGPDDEVPKGAIDIGGVSPVSLGLPESCPADISLGNGHSFSFGPLCANLQTIRPLVIGLGWLAAGMIVVAALRTT